MTGTNTPALLCDQDQRLARIGPGKPGGHRRHGPRPKRRPALPHGQQRRHNRIAARGTSCSATGDQVDGPTDGL
jgi:hypothetical protein